ncbi:MAG: hypothetical protein H0U59_03650 [Gemmatimonadaceae bacterium]|nr:hypothetical protein [Gemmatimonadaceae bacterium]MDQ3243432.1 hypothetical protein [Gemmatimonadota bacterium]
MNFWRSTRTIAAVILASCSGDSSRPNPGDTATLTSRIDSAPSPASGTTSGDDGAAPVRARIAAATSRAPCLHTGLWEQCSVEKRLAQAGFVVKRIEGEARRPGFSIPATVLQLGRSRLEVFVYQSEADMARDIARLDTLRVAPPGVQPLWDVTPMLIRSGNLAAVLLSQNARQAERVALALTAGAPQPGSPR